MTGLTEGGEPSSAIPPLRAPPRSHGMQEDAVECGSSARRGARVARAPTRKPEARHSGFRTIPRIVDRNVASHSVALTTRSYAMNVMKRALDDMP